MKNYLNKIFPQRNRISLFSGFLIIGLWIFIQNGNSGYYLLRVTVPIKENKLRMLDDFNVKCTSGNLRFSYAVTEPEEILIDSRNNQDLVLPDSISELSDVIASGKKKIKATPYLSDTMNFEQVELAMEVYPASFEYGDERLKIMESLDALIDFSVKHDSFYLNPGNVQRLKDMVQFYRKRVDRGLEALEKTKVKHGVHVFKFYSSSVVLKSAEGTVAVDFCQGPVQNDGEPEKTDLYNSGFYMTPEQRNRLAKLIDVQLITHQHHDHADYSLASRLVKSGKTVIGPSQLKNKWKDISSGITVPNYETVEKFGPVEIFTQFGYQYGQSIKLEDGTTKGIPSTDPSSDSETIRYLIKIGQIIFLQSGENQTEAYDWLTKAASLGWTVDVLMSPGQYQGERTVLKFLSNENIQYIKLPIHEYELMHYNGGNRTAYLLKGGNRIAFSNKRLIPLLWGEDFHFTKRHPHIEN
jgi:L-ascorbate metabolism protein UlaG (beta-lactamase superfamily)